MQEALRSLEEFSKINNPPVGEMIKRLRYRVYTLQRAVDATCNGLERLATAELYVLLDGRSSVEEFCRQPTG